jgi:hypothetical protein
MLKFSFKKLWHRFTQETPTVADKDEDWLCTLASVNEADDRKGIRSELNACCDFAECAYDIMPEDEA